MDERKKILLGSEDILSKNLQDIYININLAKESREIIPYKYDNVFDLTKLQDQERNGSREFVVYGMIDSCSFDCNNLKISVYQSPDLNAQNHLLTTYSTDVVNSGMPFTNIYNKLRGKYIIDNIPVTFTGYSIYLKIQTQNQYSNTSYADTQQLIFTTLTLSDSGEKVVEILKYGLNEAVTDCDGSVNEINNDFDFFYNKHWINKDIDFLDTRTFWIGDKNSISCELQSGTTYDGRFISGIFNTGYFTYGRTMEIYQVNMLPTGNIEDNIFGTTSHYVPHFSSSGACAIPTAYTVSAEVKYLSADGNLIYTAPTGNTQINISPYDYANTYFNTEVVTFSVVNNNPLWAFKYFKVNGNSSIITPTYSLPIKQDAIAQAFMQEVCPLSFSVVTNLLNLNGSISATSYSNIIAITPNKNKFFIGEPVSVSPINNNYIESYILNGIHYNSPENGIINFNITSNSSLIINYKKNVFLHIYTNAYEWNGTSETTFPYIKLNGTDYNLVNTAEGTIASFVYNDTIYASALNTFTMTGTSIDYIYDSIKKIEISDYSGNGMIQAVMNNSFTINAITADTKAIIYYHRYDMP